jgi:predicted nucleotidyltransferase
MDKNDCIEILQQSADTLKREYGILSLRLFGSVA